MGEYTRIHSGFNNITVDYEDNPVWTPTTEDAQEQYDTILEEAEHADNLFNGPLVRVKQADQEDDVLHMDVEETNYFSHVATRDYEDYEKADRADPISVGVRLQTSDDYLVVGERSSLNEVGEGDFQIPAGFVTPPDNTDEVDWENYLLHETERELAEEVNITPDTVETVTPTSLIGANTYQPMLVYDAETSLSAEGVAEQWSEIDDEHKEFSQLAFLDATHIHDVMEGDEPARYAAHDGFAFSWTETSQEIPLRPHAEGALDTYTL